MTTEPRMGEINLGGPSNFYRMRDRSCLLVAPRAAAAAGVRGARGRSWHAPKPLVAPSLEG